MVIVDERVVRERNQLSIAVKLLERYKDVCIRGAFFHRKTETQLDAAGDLGRFRELDASGRRAFSSVVFNRLLCIG